MSDGSIISRPVFLLETEAFCVVCASCAAYHVFFPHHWVQFALLFLVPDLSLLVYAIRQRQAATMLYNLAHTCVLPALVGAFACYSGRAVLGQVSLIWFCHIGLDRMLGYGLKYPHSFKFTHLQSTASPSGVCLPDAAR